jgi:hypothetical protein
MWFFVAMFIVWLQTFRSNFGMSRFSACLAQQERVSALSDPGPFDRQSFCEMFTHPARIIVLICHVVLFKVTAGTGAYLYIHFYLISAIIIDQKIDCHGVTPFYSLIL